MKKLLSILVIMTMALSFTAAVAEEAAATDEPETAETEETAEEAETEDASEVLEIVWDDVESANADLVGQGDFVTFEDAAYKMWMPSSFTDSELTEDETQQGYVAYYTSSDGNYAVSVMDVAANGMSLDDYTAQLEANGATEIEAVTVNGISAVSYILADTDTACLAFVTDDDRIIEISGAPQSDENFNADLSIVLASVQAA